MVLLVLIQNFRLQQRTYTVSPTGAVRLVIDGESSYGFADSAGDLFTLGDPASRYYGVKLGTGNISADLANKAFELKGLVIESSNKLRRLDL